MYVNAFQRGSYINGKDAQSTLYRLEANGLSEFYRFDHAVVVSADRAGNLLCRDTGEALTDRSGCDRIINSDAVEVFNDDIGYYDRTNHYIRLDGSDGLYFLRGTPDKPYRDKKLCRINLDGSTETVMDWNYKGADLSHSIACWATDNTIIRAYSINITKNIERCEISSGRSLWIHSISALATSMTVIESSILVYALTNGVIGMLNIADGTILYEDNLMVDGFSTVATSLASNGSWLTIGTIDGRVLLYSIVDNTKPGRLRSR